MAVCRLHEHEVQQDEESSTLACGDDKAGKSPAPLKPDPLHLLGSQGASARLHKVLLETWQHPLKPSLFSSSTMANDAKKKNIAFFHPDLGIGGAERLIIDAAVGLQNRGHKVVIFTSHCDPQHCFDEARDGMAYLQSHIQPF
jgi:hypothetical protein